MHKVLNEKLAAIKYFRDATVVEAVDNTANAVLNIKTGCDLPSGKAIWIAEDAEGRLEGRPTQLRGEREEGWSARVLMIWGEGEITLTHQKQHRRSEAWIDLKSVTIGHYKFLGMVADRL